MKILNILLLVSTIFFSTDTTLDNTGNEFISLLNIEETKDLNKFMKDLGHRESTGRYYAVSKKGYLGKYQFHINTLNDIGIQTSKKEFLVNETLQDSALVLLLKHNKKILQPHIVKHSGKVVNDVEITESGILAAAHLVGAGSVRRYFNSGINKKDGNGVRLTDYLTKFSGYELEI
jgi:hypothetical protein